MRRITGLCTFGEPIQRGESNFDRGKIQLGFQFPKYSLISCDLNKQYKYSAYFASRGDASMNPPQPLIPASFAATNKI